MDAQGLPEADIRIERAEQQPNPVGGKLRRVIAAGTHLTPRKSASGAMR